MFEELMKGRVFDGEKLLSVGFSLADGTYVHERLIVDESMRLRIIFKSTGELETNVFDRETGDEYVLYKTDAAGEYVGRIREEVRDCLGEIVKKCFMSSYFRSQQTRELIDYIQEVLDHRPEDVFGEPDILVFRRTDNQKWFAFLAIIAKSKLGCDSDEMVEIVDFKVDSDNSTNLFLDKRIFPGWHMHKKSWATIILDGSVPNEDLFQLISTAYNLVKTNKNNRKRPQKSSKK